MPYWGWSNKPDNKYNRLHFQIQSYYIIAKLTLEYSWIEIWVSSFCDSQWILLYYDFKSLLSTIWYKMITFSRMPHSYDLSLYGKIESEKEKEGIKVFLLIFSYIKATFLNATRRYFRLLKRKYRNDITQPTLNQRWLNFKVNHVFIPTYIIHLSLI